MTSEVAASPAAEKDLEAIERRANDIEARITALEATASSQTSQAGASTLSVTSSQFEELVRVRATIAAALEEAKQIEALNSELKAENAALTKANERQAYRITILKSSVQDLLKQQGTPVVSEAQREQGQPSTAQKE